MTSMNFSITASNQDAVRGYIAAQFTQRSWWPTEAPWQARAAFAALDGSPEALERWCGDWLDGGQWRQLRIALERRADPRQ